MKFFALLTLSALGAMAAPNWGQWGGYNKNCLSDADAQSIADRSTIFLMHTNIPLANATAQALFSDSIQEYGDSINSLRGDALGTIVETAKQTYIAETLGSPPIPVINTIAIVHGCSQMVWQWEFHGIGSDQYRVRGMTLITVDASKQVVHQYVEFNSLAWAQDIGFNVTRPAYFPKN